jgi:hypothetical protein
VTLPTPVRVTTLPEMVASPDVTVLRPRFETHPH